MKSKKMADHIRKSEEPCLKINDEAKTSEIERIICEYKEQSNTDILTEEDLTDIFGMEALYPDYNIPMSEWTDTSWWTISEWQDYYYGVNNMSSSDNISMDNAFDEIDISDVEQLSENDQVNDLKDEYYDDLIDKYYGTIFRNDYKINEFEQEFSDLGSLDCIQPYEVNKELRWCRCHDTFEESLQEATILDRFYLIMDDCDNIIGSGLFDLGDNINEYFRIKGFNDDYEFMKVEDLDNIDEGEWEFSLAEDLEYYASLRTETIEVYVTDASEVIDYLKSDMEKTTYCLNIHWNADEGRFLIMKSDEEQFYYYRVDIESKNNKGSGSIYLGSSIDPWAVPDIIEYYIITGKSLGQV